MREGYPLDRYGGLDRVLPENPRGRTSVRRSPINLCSAPGHIGRDEQMFGVVRHEESE